MTLFRGADEVVIGDTHPLPQVTEFGRDFVGVLLRSFSRGLGRALYLLPVLISAGQKESVGAQKPLPARHRVAGDRRVSVPDMRPRIDVINRGRDVKLSAHEVFVVPGLWANTYARRLWYPTSGAYGSRSMTSSISNPASRRYPTIVFARKNVNSREMPYPHKSSSTCDASSPR